MQARAEDAEPIVTIEVCTSPVMHGKVAAADAYERVALVLCGVYMRAFNTPGAVLAPGIGTKGLVVAAAHLNRVGYLYVELV